MAVSTGAALLGGAALGVAGSYLGGKEQRKGAEAAAAATLTASREAREAYEPFREAGVEAIPELKRLAAERGEGKYLPYLEHMVTGEGKPFDIQTSPMYQYQLEKGTEAIGKSAAARGGYASGAAIEAEGELARRLGAEESGMMYGRMMDLYNIGQQQGTQQYGRQLDLAKIGAGAAGQAGAASMATGQQLAGIAGERGRAGAQMYSNIANIGMAGVGAYQQQRGYEDLMSRTSEASYRGAGGYGPYQY